MYNYNELKNIKDIEKFFDIRKEGNWEGKIILDEIREPDEKIIEQLLKIREKRKNHFLMKKHN